MAHDVKLGALIEGEQQRDAIHIAVAPVVAVERLYPGQEIGFVSDDMRTVGGKTEKLLGIVDPFLRGAIHQGQQFWMFLYPQTITSLRHDWAHPAFAPAVKDVPDKEASQAWMEAFAKEVDLSLEELIAVARKHHLTGEYVTQYDDESQRDAMYAAGVDVFWKHYQVVTGEDVGDEDGSVFTCSC